eukprot:TRINITY_DN23984_c0_g1_i1.p1 TRINITY_DN23984_c0_g1~~TRINITY_DN23984_c0_g1_i1.p1  ORF type:complete len:1194 (-),score=130.20 TRINITY_DN23984_c0_g1_i1:37-3396(-)
MAKCRNAWDAGRVSKCIRTPLIIMTTAAVYLLTMAGVSLFFCGVNIYQSVAPDPSAPLLFPVYEEYATYVHALEMFIVWIDAATQTPKVVLELGVSRLLTDCALVVPVLVRVFGGYSDSTFSIKYIGVLRAYTLWYLFCKSRRSTAVMQLLGAITVLGAVWIGCANAVLQVELLPGHEWPGPMHVGLDPLLPLDENPPAVQWSFSASCYFVLSSCTTVGFGDLYPRTVPGQLCMLIVTTSGAFQILKATLGIARAINTGLEGGGYYESSNRSKHIVVAGSFSFPIFRDFLEELYHEDHAEEAEDLNTIVLFLPGQTQQMSDLRVYLRQNAHLMHRVHLLKGSALKHQDLDRASYKDCATAFLLPNMFASDPEREDLDNVMRALSMQRHTTFVRIIPFLLQVENRELMMATGVNYDDIICANEIKLGLFGTACQVSGFTTVVVTLLKSMSAVSTKDLNAEDYWSEHYVHGLENELYEQPLSLAYMGAPFFDVARDILQRSKGSAYLIGIVEESLYPGDPIITRMFPGRHFRLANDHDRKLLGIFIARDLASIKQHSPYSQFKWSIGEKAMVAAQEKAALILPNAVPDSNPAEDAHSSSFQLPNGTYAHHRTPGKSGWVLDPFVVHENREKSVASTMMSAAYRRASQGLTVRGGRSQREADAVLGQRVQVGDSAAEAMKAEDDALANEDADNTTKAVTAQLAKMQKGAAIEKKEVERQKKVKELERATKRAKHTCERIETGENDLYMTTKDDAQAQMDDIELVGHPYPAPPAVWATPQEPPPWVLSRGGHVLFLALEGHSESKGDTTVGSRLSLNLFIRTLRSDPMEPMRRPVVVLAEKVPLDWPTIAAEGDVYLSLGRPLSATGLRRAGLRHAHAVVIHHSGNAKGKDANAIDSEAIFACRVVDSVLCDENRDCRVLCDLVLERNSVFVPLSKHEKTRSAPVKIDYELEKEREMDDAEKGKFYDESRNLFHMEPRFITGQLFSSSVLISMVANQLYNHALGSMIRELVRSRVTAVPVPEEWKGRTFGQLFEFMMLRKNLLVLALLRRQDAEVETHDFEDDDPEEEQHDNAEKKVTKKERWSPAEPSWRHYCYVSPSMDRVVAEHDGLLCILPSVDDVGLV